MSARPRHRGPRRRPRGPAVRRRDESGQTAVLIIGFAVLVALVVVTVVDASAAYLRRQALNTLADGAALAAADAVREEHLYTEGVTGHRATLDPVAAAGRVEAYLAASGARGRYPRLSHVVRVQQGRVVVAVAAPLELPFAVPGMPDRARITATAAAVPSLGDPRGR